MFHPASLLLVWGAGLIVLQGLNRWPLVLVAAVVVGLAGLIDRPGFFRMVSRSRYLFLSMLLLFIFMTPGVRLPGFAGAAGVTWEGAEAAAEHCVRLLAMLALVVVLIRTLGRSRMVIGLVALMRPIAILGLDFRALAVRLALTLEEVAGDKRRSWRDYLEAVVPGEGGTLHLERLVWRGRDSMLLLALVLGLAIWGWIV